MRFSTSIGLPIVEDSTEDFLGNLSNILINPDSGSVEGFFVNIPQFLSSSEVFLGSIDVLKWGARIYVSSRDILGPVEDRIRLLPLLDDPRTMIGQRIRTEGGLSLGRCKDVQFDTEKMRVEWLFPKKFFRWGIALPISEVIEVRNDAIVVRNQASTEVLTDTVQDEQLVSIESLSEKAV